MSATDNPRRSGSRWVVMTAVLLVLFILWPLSIGPVVWLFAHRMPSEPVIRVFEVVYAPWDWLYHNSKAVEAFFEWYLRLWDPHR